MGKNAGLFLGVARVVAALCLGCSVDLFPDGFGAFVLPVAEDISGVGGFAVKDDAFGVTKGMATQETIDGDGGL